MARGKFIARERVRGLRSDLALLAYVWDKHQRAARRGDCIIKHRKDGLRAKCPLCAHDDAVVFNTRENNHAVYFCHSCAARGSKNADSVIGLHADNTGRDARRDFVAVAGELLTLQRAMRGNPATAPVYNERVIARPPGKAPSRAKWLYSCAERTGILSNRERVLVYILFAGFSRHYPLAHTDDGVARAAAATLNIPFATARKAVSAARSYGLLGAARCGFDWQQRDIARGRAAMSLIAATRVVRKLARLRVVLEFYVRGMTRSVKANYARLREKCACTARTIARVVRAAVARGIAIVRKRVRTALHLAMTAHAHGVGEIIPLPLPQPPPPT